MKKKICLLAVLALLLSGCAREEKTADVPELMEPVGVVMDTAVVVRAPLTTVTAYEGSMVAQSEELSFAIDGYIGEMHTYVGQWVEEGQLLMTLDQDNVLEQIEVLEDEIAYIQQNAQYDDAVAELDIERIALDVAQLQKQGNEQALQLRQMDLEQAKMDLRQTQDLRTLQLEEKQVRLSMLKDEVAKGALYAPFSGHFMYDAMAAGLYVGTYVQAEKPIAYLVNPADLELVLPEYVTDRTVENSYCYALIGGQTFELEHLPMEQEEMLARIFAEKPLTTSFRLKGTEEELAQVAPGTYAAVCMETLQKDMVLQIPNDALYSAGTKRYVYVMHGTEREKRDVKVGKSNGIVTEIEEGLEEGEVVYIND